MLAVPKELSSIHFFQMMIFKMGQILNQNKSAFSASVEVHQLTPVEAMGPVSLHILLLKNNFLTFNPVLIFRPLAFWAKVCLDIFVVACYYCLSNISQEQNLACARSY